MSHESGCCLSGNRTGMTNLVTKFSRPDWFTFDFDCNMFIFMFIYFFWVTIEFICSLVLFYL